MLRCKMNQCFYFDNRGICLNSVAAIDENGMCDIFWYKGNFRPKYQNPQDQHMNKRKEENIIEIKGEDLKDDNGGNL